TPLAMDERPSGAKTAESHTTDGNATITNLDLTMRHLISLFELASEELNDLLVQAQRMKKAHLRGKNKPLLAGKALGLIFEKPSLRTRVSFQAGIAPLRGSPIV